MSRYGPLRRDLKTGDLVLFSGKGAFSAAIKWFTGGRVSHVGMVLRLEALRSVMLWESTTLSTVPDHTTGRLKRGVQLVPLSQRLAKYEGSAWVRALEGTLRADADATLGELREAWKDLDYEESRIELLRSALPGPLDNHTEDLQSFFCSELVAETLERLGVLQPGIPSNSFTPRDFCDDRQLPMAPGFGYLEEVRLL